MITWLASYPRSGNSFLRILLHRGFGLPSYSIYGEPVEKDAPAPFRKERLPADWSLEKVRSDEKMWFVKTHELPPDDEPAIYIIRDGRESMTSYVHFLRSYFDPGTSLWDVMAGDTPHGEWTEHAREWNPSRRNNTLLLKFEELTSFSPVAMEPLARCVGKEPALENVPSFSKLNALDPVFYRSGRNDSWKSEFTPAQQFAFWLLNRETMLAHGYHDEIPGLFAEELSPKLQELAETARARIREDVASGKKPGVALEEKFAHYTLENAVF